jgi:protein CMS1
MGAPHTIIVTASGIRAADVCRSLKSGLPKQGVEKPSVAKLFAKHMKVAEQVAFLNKEKYAGRLSISSWILTCCRIGFGVGTPDRLAALLEDGALSTANLKQVVIDVSYIDQKKRGILDMKELHESLLKFLLRKNFIDEEKEIGEGLFLFY